MIKGSLDIVDFVYSIREIEDARSLLIALLNKRLNDGLNGRKWDASRHLIYENSVSRIINTLAAQPKQGD